MTFYHKFCQKWVDISQNQCILKAEFRFGIFGFGSANLTKISVLVLSIFTRFGRPLLKWESHPRPSHHHSKTSFWLLLVWSQQSWLFIFYCVKKDTTKKLKIGRQRPTTLLCVFLVSLVGRTPSTTTIYCKTYNVWRVKKLKPEICR